MRSTRIWAVCTGGIPLIYFEKHSQAIRHLSKCLKEDYVERLLGTTKLTVEPVTVWSPEGPE